MRVKLKTLLAGPKGCHQPGEEIDVSDTQGNELIAGGYATAAAASAPAAQQPAAPGRFVPGVETAAVAQPATAITRAGKPARRAPKP